MRVGSIRGRRKKLFCAFLLVIYFFNFSMPLSAYAGLVSDPIINIIEQERFAAKLNLLLTANDENTAFLTMSQKGSDEFITALPLEYAEDGTVLYEPNSSVLKTQVDTSEPAATEPQTDTPSEPAATEPQTDTPSEPAAAEPQTDTPSEPAAAEPQTDTPSEPAAAEPQADTPSEPAAAEPQTDTPSEPAAAEPQADTPSEPAAAEPQTDTPSEPAAAEPQTDTEVSAGDRPLEAVPENTVQLPAFAFTVYENGTYIFKAYDANNNVLNEVEYVVSGLQNAKIIFAEQLSPNRDYMLLSVTSLYENGAEIICENNENAKPRLEGVEQNSEYPSALTRDFVLSGNGSYEFTVLDASGNPIPDAYATYVLEDLGQLSATIVPNAQNGGYAVKVNATFPKTATFALMYKPVDEQQPLVLEGAIADGLISTEDTLEDAVEAGTEIPAQTEEQKANDTVLPEEEGLADDENHLGIDDEAATTEETATEETATEETATEETATEETATEETATEALLHDEACELASAASLPVAVPTQEEAVFSLLAEQVVTASENLTTETGAIAEDTALDLAVEENSETATEQEQGGNFFTDILASLANALTVNEPLAYHENALTETLKDGSICIYAEALPVMGEVVVPVSSEALTEELPVNETPIEEMPVEETAGTTQNGEGLNDNKVDNTDLIPVEPQAEPITESVDLGVNQNKDNFFLSALKTLFLSEALADTLPEENTEVTDTTDITENIDNTATPTVTTEDTADGTAIPETETTETEVVTEVVAFSAAFLAGMSEEGQYTLSAMDEEGNIIMSASYTVLPYLEIASVSQQAPAGGYATVNVEMHLYNASNLNNVQFYHKVSSINSSNELVTNTSATPVSAGNFVAGTYNETEGYTPYTMSVSVPLTASGSLSPLGCYEPRASYDGGTITAESDVWVRDQYTGTAALPTPNGDVYEITTANQLAALAETNNSFAGKTFYLNGHFDISTYPGSWAMIGSSTTFNGIIQGGISGTSAIATVSGMNISSNQSNAGFISSMAGATIEGISIVNSSITNQTSGNMGILVGRTAYISSGAASTINHCSVENSTINGYGSYIGGLVGTVYNNITVDNCAVYCDITVPAGNAVSYLGGVLGYPGTGIISVSNTLYAGNINGGNTRYVGGIIATMRNSSASVSGCVSMGSIVCNSTVGAVRIGGIASTNTGGSITSSSSNMSITVSTGTDIETNIGGICAYLESTGTVTDCVANAAIYVGLARTSNSRVGGLVGYIQGTALLQNCLFTGSISQNNKPVTYDSALTVACDTANLGTIAGYVANSALTISNCYFDDERTTVAAPFGIVTGTVGNATSLLFNISNVEAIEHSQLLSGSSLFGANANWSYTAGSYPALLALKNAKRPEISQIAAFWVTPIVTSIADDTTSGIGSARAVRGTVNAVTQINYNNKAAYLDWNVWSVPTSGNEQYFSLREALSQTSYGTFNIGTGTRASDLTRINATATINLPFSGKAEIPLGGQLLNVYYAEAEGGLGELTNSLVLLGAGTLANPFQISSKNDWVAFANGCANVTYGCEFNSAVFEMTQSISFEDETFANWVGAGTDAASKYFYGTFEGNSALGYKIDDLLVTSGTMSLFGVMQHATVRNLTVYGIVSNGSSAVDIIARKANGLSRISNCVFDGFTSSSSNGSAGIVGENNGIVENCRTYGNLAYAGIAGINRYSGVIRNCYSSAFINNISNSYTATPTAEVSGIAYNNYGLIEGCYFLGTAASGIASENYATGTIQECFAMGTAYTAGISNNNAGTIIGSYAINHILPMNLSFDSIPSTTTNTARLDVAGIAKNNTGTIHNCYFAGSFDTKAGRAGIAFMNSGTITNSYYDNTLQPNIPAVATGTLVDGGRATTVLADTSASNPIVSAGAAGRWLNSAASCYPQLARFAGSANTYTQNASLLSSGVKYLLVSGNAGYSPMGSAVTFGAAPAGTTVAYTANGSAASGSYTLAANSTVFAGTAMVSQAEAPEHTSFSITLPKITVNSYMPLTGAGTEASPYLISNETELRAFKTYVDNGGLTYGKYFRLEADIDLNPTNASLTETNMEPIGATGNYFAGTFLGNNKKISDLYYYSATRDQLYAGLFAALAGGSTIKDLTLENAKIDATNGTILGTLAGMASGTTIENCTVEGKNGAVYTAVIGRNLIGGLVGAVSNGTSINGCAVVGNVYSNSNNQYSGYCVGGITGSAITNISITNSYCSGAVYVGCTTTSVTRGAAYIGGIVGYLLDNCSVSNTYMLGNVTAEYTNSDSSTQTRASYLGGIAGSAENTCTFTNVFSTGNVKAIKPYTSGSNYAYYVGGILGYGSIVNITGSFSTGDIEGERYVGGIVGNLYRGSNVTTCYSRGVVAGTSQVGGIAGRVQSVSGGTLEVSYCYSTAQLSGTAGGIIGEMVGYSTTNPAKMNNCYYDYQIGGIANAVATISSGTVPLNGVSYTDKEVLDAYGSKTTGFFYDNTNVSTWTSHGWALETGCYPQVQILRSNDNTKDISYIYSLILARFYDDGIITEQRVGVSRAFEMPAALTIPSVGVSQNITWTQSIPDIFTVTGGTTYMPTVSAAGDLQLSSSFTIVLEGLQAPVVLKQGLYINVFDGGSGTAEDPYTINSVSTLMKFVTFIASGKGGASYYKLTKGDAGTPTAGLGNVYDLTGINWKPIGYSDTPTNTTFSGKAFNGTLNGNHKVMANIAYSGTDNYYGAFGYIEAGIIYNLTVQNPQINSTGSYIGGFAGKVSQNASQIVNCTVTGGEGAYVKGLNYVGGLIGNVVGGSIELCGSAVDVTCNNQYGGGFVGMINTDTSIATINNCYATGNVSAVNGYAGGFCGSSTVSQSTSRSYFNHCFATGKVTAANQDYAGGFIGYLYATSGEVGADSASMVGCYAFGDVTGVGYTGGFVGCAKTYLGNGGRATLNFDQCYATGVTVGSGSYAGGFAGELSSYGNNVDNNTYSYYSTIKVSNSYAGGSVQAAQVVGSFVGQTLATRGSTSTLNTITYDKCYALGMTLGGGANVAGFAGKVGYSDNGLISDATTTAITADTSAYNMQTTGGSLYGYGGTLPATISFVPAAKTTAQMIGTAMAGSWSGWTTQTNYFPQLAVFAGFDASATAVINGVTYTGSGLVYLGATPVSIVDYVKAASAMSVVPLTLDDVEAHALTISEGNETYSFTLCGATAPAISETLTWTSSKNNILKVENIEGVNTATLLSCLAKNNAYLRMYEPEGSFDLSRAYLVKIQKTDKRWIDQIVPVQEITPVGNTYTVTNQYQLAWIAQEWFYNHNDFADKTIEIAANINLSGRGWYPLGGINSANVEQPFAGNFVGNVAGGNARITNVTVDETIIYNGLTAYSDKIAFFGTIAAGGSAENITLVSPVIINECDISLAAASTVAAGLVGVNYGTVSDCAVVHDGTDMYDSIFTSTGVTDATLSNVQILGGLAGINHSVIQNSYAEANAYGVAPYQGGLVGQNNGTVSGSHATGVITMAVTGSNNKYLGGIAGYNTGTISGSRFGGSAEEGNANASLSFIGDFASTGYYVAVGGISAETTGTIESCELTGAVIENNAACTSNIASAYVGGITGKHEGGSISRSDSDATLTENSNLDIYMGGVAGYAAGSGKTMLSSSATGSLISESTGGNVHIGGVIGYTNTANYADRCYSFAYITNNSDNGSNFIYMGGAAGLIAGGTNALTNSFAAGNLTSNTAIASTIYMGGLVGGVATAGSVNYCYSTGSVKRVGGAVTNMGGLAGRVTADNAITNSYTFGTLQNAAPLIGTTNMGYLATGNYSLSNCAYDKQLVGTSTASTSNGTAIAYTTAQLLSGTGFGSGWTIENGRYPQITALRNSAYGYDKEVSQISVYPYINFGVVPTDYAERSAGMNSVNNMFKPLSLLGTVRYTDSTDTTVSQALNWQVNSAPVGSFIREGNLVGASDALSRGGGTVSVAVTLPNGSIYNYERILSSKRLFETGSGLPSTPFVVNHAATDFAVYLHDVTDTYLSQGKALDLTGITIQPTEGFSGHYNGNGYEIANLTINSPAADNIGIFATTQAGSTIDNLGLVNVNITGHDYVGTLIGRAAGGTITGVYVTGMVNGNEHVGGLVGGATNTSFDQVYAMAEVAAANNAGGLAGSFITSTLNHSYSTGYVQATGALGKAGGLVGDLGNNSAVTYSYFAGTVSAVAANAAGAIAGSKTANANINNTYYDQMVSGVLYPLADSTAVVDASPLNPKLLANVTAEQLGDSEGTIWLFKPNSMYPQLALMAEGGTVAQAASGASTLPMFCYNMLAPWMATEFTRATLIDHLDTNGGLTYPVAFHHSYSSEDAPVTVTNQTVELDGTQITRYLLRATEDPGAFTADFTVAAQGYTFKRNFNMRSAVIIGIYVDVDAPSGVLASMQETDVVAASLKTYNDTKNSFSYVISGYCRPKANEEAKRLMPSFSSQPISESFYIDAQLPIGYDYTISAKTYEAGDPLGTSCTVTQASGGLNGFIISDIPVDTTATLRITLSLNDTDEKPWGLYRIWQSVKDFIN